MLSEAETVTLPKPAPPRSARERPLDARALASALASKVDGEVRFDDGSRALYATDGSNYRQVPIGVVVPRTEADVLATIALCRDFGAPILSRGGGTSLAGQCCNVAVVMDFSKYMNRVLGIDRGGRLGRVQPGCILDDLRQAARREGLTFGPDPATHTHNTLGGMIGNDSCGVHSVMAAFAGTGARTADNVEEMEIVTADGERMRVGATSEDDLAAILRAGGRRAEIYGALRDLRDRYAAEIRSRFPDIPRRVSGFNLPYLLPEKGFHVARALVGSEGTCVTVLEATMNLIPEPGARSLLVLGFADVYTAADRVPEIMRHRPIGLEGMDHRLIADMKAIGLHPRDVRLLPEGKGWLLVEFGGRDKTESDGKARDLLRALGDSAGMVGHKLFDDPEEERQIWKVRESGLGATAHVPHKAVTWEGWEDSAVPPEKLGDYLRELRRLLEAYRYEGDFYGHFGQGCLHTRIDFDLETAPGIERYRRFVHDAARLVVSFGGSLSGEHGDGQSRAELLPIMFGERLVGAFREFKAIWDPGGLMNPGKVVDPYGITENLRLGADYRPRETRTHFGFPGDRGSFAFATIRCVGVGKCRRLDGGTMCPSFMVTREEEHSTRGRARLLFEMMRGDSLPGGWRSEAVRDALDLCLACKGCKGDCPVNVDMATYKAEFLSHYYAGRLRPRHAYAMGLIPWVARAASLAPRLVNLAARAPGISALVKLAAGIAPEREIPAFAPETFKAWFARRRERADLPADAPRVVLFADTFNNHFHPGTAKAAVAVLQEAGFRVSVPGPPLCCGRPLYDFGMLDLAARQLRRILRILGPEVRKGIPVVVLEPSCAAVFRDELRNLFPADEDARRLSESTLLLSELLRNHAPGWAPPRLSRSAVVQAHCHHRAVIGIDDERALLDSMGLDVDVLDSGCCGMAGSFGFERGDHYAVSVAAGERVLLPAVRSAPKETIVVADGFSCREQIAQRTDRRALHLAEVLRLAADFGPDGPGGAYPEAACRAIR